MLKIRLVRSAAPFADLSLDSSGEAHVLPGEASRKIPEKWLFAFADDFDALARQLHVGLSPEHFETQIKKKAVAFTKLLFEDHIALFTSESPAVFTIDREYAHIPFEALCDGKNFMCDLRPVLRVLRLNSVATSRKPTPRGRQFYNVASAPDHPQVLRSAIHECKTLSKLAQKSRIKTKIIEDVVNPRLGVFLENLQNADYLHFAGHATESEIPLAGETVFVAEDAQQLNLTRLQIAFVNACDSAADSDDRRMPLSYAFVAAGVRNFIGYARPVPNKAAEICAGAFWQHFLNGAVPAESVAAARQALKSARGVAGYRFFLRHFGSVEAKESQPTLLWKKAHRLWFGNAHQNWKSTAMLWKIIAMGVLALVVILLYDTITPTQKLSITRITASSILPTSPNYTYIPKNAIDSNRSTAWGEGVKGDGIGESLDFDFGKTVLVTAMDIVNGFTEMHTTLGNLYFLNNRIKKIKIIFDDGEEEISLRDNWEAPQYIKLVSQHKTTKAKVTISEIYKGQKWDDTLISEINFFGK
ncbi:MAG: CHAT domain-containing protein [Spirochaetes bacterium]|nr:CHAT domain-containing protein [Spirochaetota bacterium]